MKCLGESIFLALVIVSLSVVISAVRDQAYGQNPLNGILQGQTLVNVKLPAEPSGYLVDFVSVDDPTNPARKLRVITVVDPKSQRIAVYHENLVDGSLKLCSVRKIQGDLQFDQFNPTTPTPLDVEEGIKRFRKQSQLEERAL